jgi:SulP family sulfate permease
MSIKNYFRGSDYFNQPPELENLTPEQIINLKDKYAIIDVRTGFEYRHGHLKGSIPYKLGKEDEIEKKFSKDEPIILICKTGHRSRAAANRLVRRGYKKLYHLQGGMNTWRKEKFPEEK